MKLRKSLLVFGMAVVLTMGNGSMALAAEAAPTGGAAGGAAAASGAAASETAPAAGGEAAAQPQTDPTATNLGTAYPLPAAVLPPLPVKPASFQDVAALTKYMNEVKAYMDAAQKYIDGTTNDLNQIIAQRNEAIGSANKVIGEYNAFLDANKQQ